jgi:hypothetical protein
VLAAIVLELGMNATVSSQATQQITLTLDLATEGHGQAPDRGPEQAGER